ncbi:CcdB family protein [Rhizobium sp. RAF36]|jgi:toxin CcdB|uniref:CcdB family protein n=1 Tax=Rhizobium sp. RAF36 TaxID=3233055 RepID=UPI000DDA9723
MTRFMVYRMRSDGQLAIDLQSNVLEALPSRMMAPLYSASNMSWSISRLNPRFMIGGEAHVLATQRMAAIPISEIGDSVVSLEVEADGITAALDFLFQGF